MYRTLYSLTFWVNDHRCWLVLRECLYRHRKVLLVSFCCCSVSIKALIGPKQKHLPLTPSPMCPVCPSCPPPLMFPGANSTAASTSVPFRSIWLRCIQGSSASGESSLRRTSYRSTVYPARHRLCHQMTLDILVSLGSRGSMALLPWASSRLCWRGDLDCGRCPLMSVMGMLQ